MNSSSTSLEYGNYGKTGGCSKTAGTCSCGSCTSKTPCSSYIFRPFIWLFLIIAIVGWFFYSIMVKPKLGKRKSKSVGLRLIKGG